MTQLTYTVWQRMVGVVFPPRHGTPSRVEAAGVVELLGEVPSEGLANWTGVEEPGLQHDGVVPGVAGDTSGVPRVRGVLADLGNTLNTQLTGLHLAAALTPDVSHWVGFVRQLKARAALVFKLSARDPVRNPSSPRVVARVLELQKTLYLAGVSKLWQLVVEVWTMPVPPGDKVRRTEGWAYYLTLWKLRRV